MRPNLRRFPWWNLKSLFSAMMVAVLIPVSTLHAQPSSETAAEARPPNVILLIGDDHGWPYYGFMGSDTVQTPHLDRLAREGTLFPLAHTTSSLCRPALLTLLTGLLPIQYFKRVDELPDERVTPRDGTQMLPALGQKRWSFAIQNFRTLPRLLSKAGYVSFEGGKFWEGPYGLAGFTEGMSKNWSRAIIDKHGFLHALAGGDGLAFGRETMEPVYDFIRRNRDRPFFIWYAPMLPHTPHDPPERHLKPYPLGEYSESARKYYANCTWFDEGVGRLVDFLRDEELHEKTLLIYINDNGWEQGPHEDFTGHPEYSGLGGPKGKSSLHDFGFRTPIVFNGPEGIPRGKRVEGLTSAVDLFPTILDYVGVAPPRDTPGRSLRRAIESEEVPPRERIIGMMTQLRGEKGWKPYETTGYYLRTSRWHFIYCRDKQLLELYDMENDPGENSNVVADHPELVEKFTEEIISWREEVTSRIPPLEE